MEIIEVASDIYHSRSLYRKYFAFERRRHFRKNNIGALAVTGFILLLAGLILAIPVLSALGLVIVILLSLFLLYSMIRFQLSCNRFLEELKQQHENDTRFTFHFDDEKIIYQSPLKKVEVKWQLLSGYYINENDIYLYIRKDQLFDIVSESILGEAAYTKFRMLAESRIKQFR